MTSPSPPRQRRRRRDTPSPKAAEGDPSPPRESRQRESPSGFPTRRARRDSEEKAKATSPPPRRRARLGSKEARSAAGLLTAKEFREEIRKIKEVEERRFAAMDPSLTGKGAKPVFRDKQGRRISEQQMLSADEPNKPKEEDKLEWGSGLVQKREAEARSRELEAERSKPFARSKDDPELDAMLRSRVRWGDPMAHLVKQAKEEFVLRNLGDDDKMRGSGFAVPQDVPNHSWMRRGVDPPANRYGVKPGRHWDGVDRGNGFESGVVMNS